MYKVFFYSCHVPEDKLKQWLDLYTVDASGAYKNISSTLDEKSADFAIVFGTQSLRKYRNNFNKPICLIQREPKFVRDLVLPRGVNFVREVFSYERYYHVSTPWVLKTREQLLARKTKTKKMSIITSNKWKHRIDLISKINSKTGFLRKTEAEIFGKDNLTGKFGATYKGVLRDNWICRASGLESFHFSMAIENSREDNYFSEKLTDCFLMDTMPIYYGCPNIKDFFPEDSIRIIEPQHIEDDCYLQEVIFRPISERESNALEESKMLVLDKFSIWATIEKYISGE